MQSTAAVAKSKRDKAFEKINNFIKKKCTEKKIQKNSLFSGKLMRCWHSIRHISRFSAPFVDVFNAYTRRWWRWVKTRFALVPFFHYLKFLTYMLFLFFPGSKCSPELFFHLANFFFFFLLFFSASFIRFPSHSRLHKIICCLGHFSFFSIRLHHSSTHRQPHFSSFFFGDNIYNNIWLTLLSEK